MCVLGDSPLFPWTLCRPQSWDRVGLGSPPGLNATYLGTAAAAAGRHSLWLSVCLCVCVCVRELRRHDRKCYLMKIRSKLSSSNKNSSNQNTLWHPMTDFFALSSVYVLTFVVIGVEGRWRGIYIFLAGKLYNFLLLTRRMFINLYNRHNPLIFYFFLVLS